MQLTDNELQHRPTLLRYIKRMKLPDGMGVSPEDIVQDVLAKWIDASGIDPAKARWWFYTTAKNMVINVHQRYNRAPFEGLPESEEGDDLLPGHAAAEETAEQIVAQAIKRLRPAERKLARLKMRDMPHNEIADRLRIPRARIRMQISRTTRRLKDILERTRVACLFL